MRYYGGVPRPGGTLVLFLRESMEAKSKRVLVVDDEPSITELLEVLLEREGLEVSSASNGSEALRILDRVNPDLIITDITMPDMEGVEFISKLRKKGVSSPIIAMSGNAVGMGFLKASKLFGAAETLLKPFSKHDLITAVKRLINIE